MKKKTKIFQEKNKLVQFWCPYKLADGIEDYLQHYCQGDTFPARMRVFWTELLNKEQQGITIVNPIKDDEIDRRKSIRAPDDPNKICIRQANIQSMDERTKAVFCGYCKDKHPDEFRACFEIRADLQKEFR